MPEPIAGQSSPFWGVIIYNTLVRTGAFDGFKRWLVAQATADVRVQAILLAWALGALRSAGSSPSSPCSRRGS